MASNNKRGSKYTCWPFCCFLFAPLCIVVYLEPAAAAAARMVALHGHAVRAMEKQPSCSVGPVLEGGLCLLLHPPARQGLVISRWYWRNGK
jgi:hypothetical protein